MQASEKTLKPLILRLFDKTSIVSRTDYLAMEKDRDYFQKKYSEERLERVKLQRELDEVYNRNPSEKDINPQSKYNEFDFDAFQFIQEWSSETKANFRRLISEINALELSYDVERFRSMNLIEKYRDSRDDSYYKSTNQGIVIRDTFLSNSNNTL